MISSLHGSLMLMLILVWELLQREDASCITDVSKILMHPSRQHRPHPQEQEEQWKLGIFMAQPQYCYTKERQTEHNTIQ